MRDVLELIERRDMTEAEIAEAMAAYPRCDEGRCGAKHAGYMCSREPQHLGHVHAAYGGEGYLCALWPDAPVGEA